MAQSGFTPPQVAENGPAEQIELSNEWHARPNISLAAPFRCTHLVEMHGDRSAADAHARLAELCAHYGQSQPAAGSRYHILEAGLLPGQMGKPHGGYQSHYPGGG